MATDQEMEPDHESEGRTQLGERRAARSSSPATDTGATQLGSRRRAEDTPRPSAGTQLGQRNRAASAPPVDDTQPGRDGATADEAAPVQDTQLGNRARVSAASADPVAPASGDTELGRRRQETADTGLGRRGGGPAAVDPPVVGSDVTPVADDEGVVRFGPGVPRTPASSPEWSRPASPGTRKKRRRPWIGALVTLALAAAVVAWLLTRVGDPVQAHAQQVTASSPPGTCDTVVDVVGTIATNGRPGSVTYQWVRNDGQPTDVLTQTVATGATSTQVHLQWSFSGHGRFDAVATLRVLDPAPASEARGAFTYSCS